MKLTITDAALADVQGIQAYIAADDPHAAQGVVDKIYHSISLLGDMPSLGTKSVVSGVLQKVVPYSNYLIMYTVSVEEVRIIAVFDGRRDYEPYISERA